MWCMSVAVMCMWQVCRKHCEASEGRYNVHAIIDSEGTNCTVCNATFSKSKNSAVSQE